MVIMQTSYIDKETRSIADLIPDCTILEHNCHLLTRINVPKEHRGKGHATKLLLKILKDADETKTTLALEISPSDGLNFSQLALWYARHNFKPADKSLPGVMIRIPQ